MIDGPCGGGSVPVAPPVGLDGGADSFDEAGPAEDAGEEVEVVAEGGPAVVGSWR